MEYTNAVNDVNGFLIWILCAVYKYRKQVEPSLRTYIYIYIRIHIFYERNVYNFNNVCTNTTYINCSTRVKNRNMHDFQER